MNVYQKMAVVKQLVNAAKFNKSGNNKFAGFRYYELGDFIPFITEVCAGNGLLIQVSFTSEIASLAVINTEQPEERIVYTIPFVVPEVEGANACQNAGAAQTYSRRYLYLSAFDIVEQDAFDAVSGKNNQPKQTFEEARQKAEQESAKRDAEAKAERQRAEQAVTIGTSAADKEAYGSLQVSWESAGRKADKLESWIRSEAVAKGITKVTAVFLQELDGRIINYMAKQGA